MIGRKQLKVSLDRALTPLRFRRKGPTWRAVVDGMIVVINLQKSDYDNQHYLNIGFYLRELGESPSPQVHKCHVRTRGESLFQDNNPSVHSLLYEDEQSLSEEEHERLVGELFSKRLVPLMKNYRQVSALKEAFRRGDLKGWLIFLTARSALGD